MKQWEQENKKRLYSISMNIEQEETETRNMNTNKADTHIGKRRFIRGNGQVITEARSTTICHLQAVDSRKTVVTFNLNQRLQHWWPMV